MTADIAAFIRARLDEWEVVALAAGHGCGDLLHEHHARPAYEMRFIRGVEAVNEGYRHPGDFSCLAKCEGDCCAHDADDYTFPRTCALCGCFWWALHCEHDGVQNPCPDCGWIGPGRRTPMQFIAGAEPA